VRARVAATTIDYAALAREVAPLLLALMGAALGATSAEPFSTREGYEPPEFKGRRKVWRKTAPTIPSSVRVGRWVSVPRAAYSAWLAAQAAPAPSPAHTDDPAPWDSGAALRSVGLRAIG
jgi:hypothetical protein